MYYKKHGKSSVLLLYAFIFVIKAEIRTSFLGGMKHSDKLILVKGKIAGILLIFLIPVPIQAVLAPGGDRFFIFAHIYPPHPEGWH